jgi:hypothetical protein
LEKNRLSPAAYGTFDRNGFQIVAGHAPGQVEGLCISNIIPQPLVVSFPGDFRGFRGISDAAGVCKDGEECLLVN